MDALKKFMLARKDDLINMLNDRKDIAIRALYAIFFSIILGILKGLILFVTTLQYIYLIITTSYSSRLRDFSNKMIGYTYRVMRYITLNENVKPYPFTDFPEIVEEPEPTVEYK